MDEFIVTTSQNLKKPITSISDDGKLLTEATVVKSIVKQHGGQVSVESEYGKGSCFSISLPLNPPPETPAALEELKSEVLN